MNPAIIGLILIGVGIAALAKELLGEEENKDAKNRSDRNGGGSSGKQNSTTNADSGRDRIVVNNIYGRPKRKTAAELDKQTSKPKEGKKKDDKQSAGSAQVDKD